MSIKLNENGDLDKFFLRFNNVVNQLKATGVDMKEKHTVYSLLMALPMVTVIENMKLETVTFDLVKC